MEEIIGILFMLFVVGGFVLKILGAVMENVLSPSKPREESRPSNNSDFAEKLRRHRLQKLAEAQAVEAEIVPDADPMRPLTEGRKQASQSEEEYYKQHEYEQDEIDTRDDQMDAHLHQVFDHSLGSLGGSTASRVQEDVLRTEQQAATKGESLAADIAALMRNPDDFRKAFILGEIMQRPANFDRTDVR